MAIIRRFCCVSVFLLSCLLSGCFSGERSQEMSEDTAIEEDSNDQRDGDTHTTPSIPVVEADPELFVEGNLYFTALHELGHALVSEFDLPIVGREEDAVDRLAIWMLIPQDQAPPDYLLGAMHGWFISSQSTPLSEIMWWDEHGADQQRAYQIACLLYGSDPEAYDNVAKGVALPEDRRETCVFESADNDRNWDRLLSAHSRAEGEAPGRPADVRIIYEPGGEHVDDRRYLQESELLENLAEIMRTDFRFRPGIQLIGRECGESNAYWVPDERTLLMCYELVAEFRKYALGVEQAGAGAMP